MADVMLAIPPAWAGIEDDIEAAMQSWADAYNSHEPARVAGQSVAPA